MRVKNNKSIKLMEVNFSALLTSCNLTLAKGESVCTQLPKASLLPVMEYFAQQLQDVPKKSLIHELYYSD